MQAGQYVTSRLGRAFHRPARSTGYLGKRYPCSIFLSGKRFLRERIFKVEFLLFKAVDEAAVRERSVFFALQFFVQFGMLHAER